MSVWKVWFDDGTTFESTDGAITDIPNKGIVVVGIKNGQQVVYGEDWYMYSTQLGKFATMTLQQLLYQVMNSPPGAIQIVRQGASTSDANFNAAKTAAETYVAS